jgi:hypothetical protein
VSNAPVCALTNLTVSSNPAAIKSNGQNKDDLTISVTRSSTNNAVCAVPNVTVSAASPATASGATTCVGTLCTRSINKNTDGWGTAPGQRTVTATSSGSTIQITLNLVAG